MRGREKRAKKEGTVDENFINLDSVDGSMKKMQYKDFHGHRSRKNTATIQLSLQLRTYTYVAFMFSLRY